MRVTIFIFLVTIFQAKALTTIAQKITINEKNVSLKEIFNDIKTQGSFDVFYSSTLIDPSSKVTVNVQQGSVEDVLNEALANLPLTYSINEKVIVITRKRALPPAPVTTAMAADTAVNGTVVDAKTKESIPGATVSIKQRKGLAITDKDGHFSLNARVGDSLIVTFVGYKPKSVAVRNIRSRLLVVLEEAVSSLGEVTVNGLFTRKNSTYTGTATTFTQDEILKGGSRNVIQSLTNLDPSIALVPNNAAGSNPNVLPQLQVRGQTGLPDLTGGSVANDPNQPLFILDGFETTLQKVVDLDIYRVASVTLLKDAASKAIYGSKAANGVVVIETIKPKPGQVRLTYNLTGGLTAPDLSSYHLTNAFEKLQAETNAGVYTSTNPASQYQLATEYNTYLKNAQSGVNTYWLSKPLQNGINQRHSFMFEGGDDRLVYGVQLAYNNTTGVMKGSGRNTFSGAINLSYRFKGLNISNVLTLTSNKATNSPWGDFSTYAYMNPYLPYYDANGNLLKQINTVLTPPAGSPNLTQTAVYNPAYNSTVGSFDYSKYTDITNNTSVDWAITPAFRVIAKFSITAQNNGSDTYKAADDTYFTSSVYTTGTGVYRRGYYIKGNGTINNWTSNAIANYTKKLGKSTAALNGGYEVSSMSSAGNSFSVEGFPNPMLTLPSQGLQYMLNTTPTSSESTVRSLGLFASGNYAFAEKYLFDGTYRASESSQFGSNNRWGQFWSLGVGWNLHYEDFLKNVHFLDLLKLRATTGFTGSQGFSAYQSVGTYGYYLNSNYQNATGAYLLSLANPDLAWQRLQENNYGVDFGFLKKISGYFNYYVKTTNGLLTDITLPPSAGFSTYKANLGIVQNVGFDFNVRYMIYNDPKKRNYFNVFATIAHNTNTLKQISAALQAYNNNTAASLSNATATVLNPTVIVNRPKILLKEGQSMNSIYAVRSLGIDPATGKEVYQKLNGSVTTTWSADDLTVVGDALPKFNTDFGFSLAQSGVIFNAIFNYQFGGQIYNQTLVDKVENANIYNNVDIRVLTQRWTKPGDISFFKNIADQTQTQVTSRFVENNRILTASSLQLQYELDRLPAIKRLGFTRFRLGVQTNNLFTISSVEQERGTTYPYAREVAFTLNANF